MRLIDAAERMRSLLEAPSPATLTLRREDGEAITSPVWFRAHEDAVELVVAITDHKLEHLRRDPRCSLLIFETVQPFRGVQVRGLATLTPDDGARTRLAIASRYLGPDRGARYADLARRPPGIVVRLPLAEARAWDLSASLPQPAAVTGRTRTSRARCAAAGHRARARGSRREAGRAATDTPGARPQPRPSAPRRARP
jgi:PPOX class probable F420-dependent enzyme